LIAILGPALVVSDGFSKLNRTMLTDGTMIHKLGVAAPETDRDLPVREASTVKKFSVLAKRFFAPTYSTLSAAST
jgi:hypothetical protein